MATIDDVTRCVERNRPGWTRFGEGLGMTAQDAEDALQNAWLRAARAVERYRDLGHPFDRWVWRIYVNECARILVSASREQDCVRRLADEMQSVSETRTGIDDSVCLWQALLCVSERDQSFVVLRYVQGLTRREVARQYGVVPRTVGRRTAAACERMRQALETAGR